MVVGGGSYPDLNAPGLGVGPFAFVGGFVLGMIYKVRMPDGVAARTDGVDIWLDDRLNEVQERCAIEHELEHVARGHSTIQTEAVEMSVRFAVAKRLLPLESIVGVCKNGKSLAGIARELQVTRQVLMDRAATLTDEQARIAGCMECQLCPVIQARYSQHPVGQRHRQLVA